jgi:hypothetical protein
LLDDKDILEPQACIIHPLGLGMQSRHDSSNGDESVIVISSEDDGSPLRRATKIHHNRSSSYGSVETLLKSSRANPPSADSPTGSVTDRLQALRVAVTPTKSPLDAGSSGRDSTRCSSDEWGADACLVLEDSPQAKTAPAREFSDSLQRPTTPSKRKSTKTAAAKRSKQQPVPVKPDYTTWTLAQLQAGVKQYGFKTSKIRATLIHQMEACWSAMHPAEQGTVGQAGTNPSDGFQSGDESEAQMAASSDSSLEVPLSASKKATKKRATTKKKKTSVVDETEQNDGKEAQKPDEIFRQVLTSDDIYLRLLRYEVSHTASFRPPLSRLIIFLPAATT